MYDSTLTLRTLFKELTAILHIPPNSRLEGFAIQKSGSATHRASRCVAPPHTVFALMGYIYLSNMIIRCTPALLMFPHFPVLQVRYPSSHPT